MFVLYIYNASGIVIAQSEKVTINQITKKLSDISRVDLQIQADDEICKRTFIKKLQNVSIGMFDSGGKEIEIFRGVITGINSGINDTQIVISDYGYILKRRYLHVAKNYIVGSSYSYLISDIISHINSIYSTGITIYVSTTDVLTTAKSYTIRTSVYDILNDLMKEGYEFIVNGKTLNFGKYIGNNLTTGENSVEYIFDVTESGTRNINSSSYSENIDNFANSILSSTGSSTDNSVSISDIGQLIEANQEDNIDPTKTLNEKLEIGNYSITGFSQDYFECEVGDRVMVNINTTNDLLYFSGSKKVLEKTAKFGDITKVEVKLSNSNIYEKDFFEKVSDLKNSINRIYFS